MSNEENKAPPVDKIKVGAVTATIWANDTDKGRFYNVTFERRFKAKEGWRSSRSYGVADLMPQATASHLAHMRILELLAQDRTDASGGNAAQDAENE